MDTIRELIIQAFITRASLIRSNGIPQAYMTDIGQKVFRARQKYDPEDLPCVDIWPQPEKATKIYGKSRQEMPVKIEGFASFGAVDPSVIGERILGDLIKCFSSPAWQSVYFESITYQSGGVESPLEDGSKSIGAQATILVVYDTAVGDPYSQ